MLGDVIRKYRKEKQMTQEEMAGYLGVTAPAVNKWESGASCPDISLLAPIARLFGISTDTLLSYQEDLSNKEVTRMSQEVFELMKTDYEAAFHLAMDKIKEYPNSEALIFCMAQMLDKYRDILGIEGMEKYDEIIYHLYERVLAGNNEGFKQLVRVLLFQHHLDKEDFLQAEKYLEQMPKDNGKISYERLRAQLYCRQGRDEEAYEIYETRLLFSFSLMTWALQGSSLLDIKTGNMKKAERLVSIGKQVGKLLDMGDYILMNPELDVALAMKDKDRCFKVLDKICEGIDNMQSHMSSELYHHMKLEPETDYSDISYILKRNFETDERMDFLKEDVRYRHFINELDKHSAKSTKFRK